MDKFMKAALKEAQKAYDKGEVPVGCVLVKDGKIIARGHNLRETKENALAHAEIVAINKACKKIGFWRLDDVKLYVTLEPCPMCSGAIIQARIPQVVYGALDKRNGSSFLFNRYPHQVEYLYQETPECSEILTKFFRELRERKDC